MLLALDKLGVCGTVPEQDYFCVLKDVVLLITGQVAGSLTITIKKN